MSELVCELVPDSPSNLFRMETCLWCDVAGFQWWSSVFVWVCALIGPLAHVRSRHRRHRRSRRCWCCCCGESQCFSAIREQQQLNAKRPIEDGGNYCLAFTVETYLLACHAQLSPAHVCVCLSVCMCLCVQECISVWCLQVHLPPCVCSFRWAHLPINGCCSVRVCLSVSVQSQRLLCLWISVCVCVCVCVCVKAYMQYFDGRIIKYVHCSTFFVVSFGFFGFSSSLSLSPTHTHTHTHMNTHKHKHTLISFLH